MLILGRRLQTIHAHSTWNIHNERPRRSKLPREKIRAGERKPSGAAPRDRRHCQLRRPAGGQILSTSASSHPQWLLTLLAGNVKNPSLQCGRLRFPGATSIRQALTPLGAVHYGPTGCGLRHSIKTGCGTGPGL